MHIVKYKFIIAALIIVMTITGCNKLTEDEKQKFKEAIINNDRQYIEYILAKGVDLNDVKTFGYIPLHIAVWQNNRELIQLFLERGANINVLDGWNRNCLFQTYDIKTVKYLIEHGASVNQVDKDGNIPLILYAWHYDLAKLYIEKGANYKHKNKNGYSLLFETIYKGNYNLLNYLLKNKIININEVDHEGYNGLFWYLFSIKRKINEKNDNIFGLLLNNKININHHDNYGDTALHWSIRLKLRKEIIKLLLDYGAEVNIKNNKGKTPLDIAIEKGDTEIINLLRR